MKKLFLILIVLLFVGCGSELEIKEYDLVQLKMGNTISGSFFLGTGSVDGSLTHYYYEKDEQGRIRFKKAHPWYDVYIVEDGGCFVRYRKLESNWSSSIREIEFHIPKGSILYDINPNIK